MAALLAGKADLCNHLTMDLRRLGAGKPATLIQLVRLGQLRRVDRANGRPCLLQLGERSLVTLADHLVDAVE